MKWINGVLRAMVIAAALLFVSSAFAAGNSGITYHGRIVRPDGEPMVTGQVQFKLQIRTPGNESCILYEEMQTVDMRNSNGIFRYLLTHPE